MSERGIIVGLTGGMASGKSTVAAIWQELGAHVLNSDATVHRLLAEDDAVKNEVRKRIGHAAFDADGQVNRAALGRIVFQDENALRRLMDILHPRTLAIHRRQAHACATAHPDGVVVIDSPLLFESGLDADVDLTVTVSAPHDLQVARAIKRAADAGHPMTREEAERRIALQMPLAEKRQRADFVIENDGTPDALRRKAESLWGRLRECPPRTAP